MAKTLTLPTLRTGRLYWLARYFEQHPKEYNQTAYCSSGCGTALCIGGLAVWQWGTDAHRRIMDEIIRSVRPRSSALIDFKETGAAILGLTPRQADRLFHATPRWLSSHYYPGEGVRQVAATLRHLARTGEVFTKRPDVRS